MLLWNCGC